MEYKIFPASSLALNNRNEIARVKERKPTQADIKQERNKEIRTKTGRTINV